ncbi:MAG: hypothetical protein ACR2PS_12160 [Pseudomonadales bacterium]
MVFKLEAPATLTESGGNESVNRHTEFLERNDEFRPKQTVSGTLSISP